MTDLILKLNEVSVGYSDVIVSGVNAQVKKGELIGLTGRNGSGKSTLIRSILGLLPLKSGRVEIHGEDMATWDVKRRAKEVAVVFSRLDQVPALSVRDLIGLGRLPYSNGFSKLNSQEEAMIDSAIELVGIHKLTHKMANQLSDGQLQMVMIARALVQDTQLVMMDEPTSHLDIENQFKIFELIDKLSKETQKTFVVASHQIDIMVQNASQLWWIDEGRFHAGYPEQVAYEQRIFDKLSQEKILFNYMSGRFEFQHPKTREVSFKGDGNALSYWLISALDRNGFALSDTSELKIEVKGDEIRLNQLKFESIEKLIHHLITK